MGVWKSARAQAGETGAPLKGAGPSSEGFPDVFSGSYKGDHKVREGLRGQLLSRCH